MKAEDRLIVALDVAKASEALRLTSQLAGIVRWVKVGSVLFSSAGRPLIETLVRDGWKVFLDLKFHDVPHQVGLSVRVLGECGVQLATLHTAGGRRMMEAAATAASTTDLKLLGVTVLTSMDQADLASVGVSLSPAEAVLRRARLAQQAGLAGVVSSPLEARSIRTELGAGFEIVTPGIRPAGVSHHDQRRVATPREALDAGASRLVVGRAITQATDPAGAARAILGELS